MASFPTTCRSWLWCREYSSYGGGARPNGLNWFGERPGALRPGSCMERCRRTTGAIVVRFVGSCRSSPLGTTFWRCLFATTIATDRACSCSAAWAPRRLTSNGDKDHGWNPELIGSRFWSWSGLSSGRYGWFGLGGKEERGAEGPDRKGQKGHKRRKRLSTTISEQM